MKKILKKTLYLIAGIILCIFSFWLGSYFNQNDKNNLKLTIDKIALVILDEGVVVGEKTKYYGLDYIGQLNDNIEITGLEHARIGLENDFYAAYIIIPATFSENIESINTKPVKSHILYKVNNNLDEFVEEEVINDIVEFNNNLCSNIEYVYLSAILKSLHTVQNDAEQLLKNDLEDMNAILKFSENEMIVDPDYPSQKHIENNVENLNITKPFQDMQKIFSDLSKNYKNNQDDAQKKYNTMMAFTNQIDNDLDDYNKELERLSKIESVDNYDVNKDTELLEAVDKYNKSLNDWKSDYDIKLAQNMDIYMKSCSENIDQQIVEAKQIQKEQLEKYYIEAFVKSGLWNLEISNDIDVLEYDSSVKDCLNKELKELINILDKQNSIIQDYSKEIERLQKMIEDITDGELIVRDITLDTINKDFNREYYTDDFSAKLIECVNCEFNNVANDVINNSKEVMKSNLNNELKKWFSEELSFYGEADSKEILEYMESFNYTDEEYYKISESEIADVLNNYFEPKLQLSVQPLDEDLNQFNTNEGNNELGEDISSNDDTKNDFISNSYNDELSDIENESDGLLQNTFLFSNTENIKFLAIDDLNDTIENALINPISSNVHSDYDNLLKKYSLLRKTWSNISYKLNDFTIDSYGDEKDRNELQKRFNDNMKELQNSVNQKAKEYISYVDQADKINEKNLQEWEKTISNANKSTRKNVDDNIKSIKENRQTLNGENNVLMENVIGLLPYTKLGELENKQVYSYIVSPLEYDDLSAQKSSQTNSAQTSSEHVVEIQWVIIAAGIILCLLSGAVLVRIMRCRNKKLQKQDL